MLIRNALKKDFLVRIIKKQQTELEIVSKKQELLEKAREEIKNGEMGYEILKYSKNNIFPSVIFTNIDLKKIEHDRSIKINNKESILIIAMIQKAIKLYQKRKNYLLYKVRELKML